MNMATKIVSGVVFGNCYWLSSRMNSRSTCEGISPQEVL